MRPVQILGVGMTKFGKWLKKDLRALGTEAVLNAVRDANISLRDIQIAHVGNSVAGLITGQEDVVGQVVLKHLALPGIPIINVSNACASGLTALFSAWISVASGYCDIALALGIEKLYCGNTAKSLIALAGDSEIDSAGRMGFQFVIGYASYARAHMKKYGTTREQFARVSVKSHKNGALNQYAQYNKVLTLEEVLNSRTIVDPLTLFMMCPMGDGAAAAIVCSADIAKRFTPNPITLSTVVVKSGEAIDYTAKRTPTIHEQAFRRAYEEAGIGPEDLGVFEVHDACASAELLLYEDLGLCPAGDGGRMIDEGVVEITGRYPVNPSGGLQARGHPVGATGLAQVTEVVWQLRGLAGERQIKPAPRAGLCQCSGGRVGDAPAASAVAILKA